MKNTIFVLAFILAGLTGAAQETGTNAGVQDKSEPAGTYDRSSLTVILLNFPGEEYMHDLQSAYGSLGIPDKFNDNQVSTRYLDAPYRHEQAAGTAYGTFSSSSQASHADEIRNLLVNRKVPNEIVAKWFGKGPDGAFSDELLRARGLYNAKDGDVMVANASASGQRLSDQGERLIGRSYILVVDYARVKSISEMISGMDDKSRTIAYLYKDKNGYVASGHAYLFQLVWNDSIQSEFYQRFWSTSKDDPVLIASRDKAFGEASFAVKYLSCVAFSAEATQPDPGTTLGKLTRQKSRNELFRDLTAVTISNGIEKAEDRIENLRVRVNISGKHPIRAKIGRKEGLRVDQRYYAYEAVQTENGIKMKRRGVIRATSKIADNRRVATGKTGEEMYSKFYQVAGRRLDAGMSIQQRNDLGIGISIGGFAQSTDHSNFMGSVGIEYNLSPLLSNMISRIPHSIKLGIEYSYGFPEYPVEYATFLPGFNAAAYSPAAAETFSLKTTRISFTLSKDFHFLRVMRFTPFVGYAMETAKFKEDLNYYYRYDPASGDAEYASLKRDTTYAKINFITAGAKLGINLASFMQLVVWVNALGPDYKGYALEAEKPAIRKNWMEGGACLHFEF